MKVETVIREDEHGKYIEPAADPKPEGYYWIRWHEDDAPDRWTVAAFEKREGAEKPAWWFFGRAGCYSRWDVEVLYVEMGHVLQVGPRIAEPTECKP